MLCGAPTVVLRWRKFWYSLPSADRADRLRRAFRREFEDHVKRQLGDTTGFHMVFRVFGKQVCREAFITITGIHADTLQAARAAALGGMSTLPIAPPAIWASRRPVAYIAARAWLLAYAKTHADTSPLCTKLFLPAGRRHFYWSVFYTECTSKGKDPSTILGLKQFLKMWRTEVPWIELRSASGPFTHCGLCDYLKMMVAQASDMGLRHSLLLRLGEHYQFQAAQRLAIANVFAESDRSPNDVLAMAWDKMDQSKTIIPRVKALSKQRYFPNFVQRLVQV